MPEGSSRTRPPRAPGRPRSEAARRAVFDAARALVEEGGYAVATVEGVAARAGVAKTTIYRWWPNRAALLVDVLVEQAALEAPMPEGGNPLNALRTELRRTAEASNGFMGQLLTALLGDAQDDPEVRSALVEGLFHPRREASAAAVRRAQALGILRADVPPYLVVDLLFGPLFFRVFARHEPVTQAFVKQVFQNVLAGLQPRGNSR